MHNSIFDGLMYVILIFITYLFVIKERIKFSYLYPIIVLILFLFIAVCRYNTGADYEMYVDMYDYVAHYVDMSFLFSHTEPLFFLLIKFGNIVFDHFNILFILIAIIIYSVLFFTVIKLSVKPTFSLLLYILLLYYFISLNQVRQSISMAIFLYSLVYLVKKPDTKKYFLINLIGLGFHYSAIVSFLVYPILKIKLTKKTMIIILVLTIFLSPLIEKVLFDYFFLLDTVYSKYDGLDEFTGKNYLAVLKLFVPNLLLVVGLKYFSFFKEKGEMILLKLCFWNVIYYNIFFGKSVFIRPGMYFEITLILFIPLLIQKFSSLKTQFILTHLLIAYYCCLVYFGIFVRGGQGVVPYKFIF